MTKSGQLFVHFKTHEQATNEECVDNPRCKTLNAEQTAATFEHVRMTAHNQKQASAAFGRRAIHGRRPGSKETYIFLYEVQATIIGYKGSNLLAILDELDTCTFSDS